jgi:putative iron-dependent peroxidase
MASNEPQGGILPEPPESALFLVLSAGDRDRDGRAVAKALARVPELTRPLARAEPRARLRSVVALGPALWDVASPGLRPRRFADFPAVDSGELRAPATGGDVLLHLAARRPDLCFELALRVRRELGDRVGVLEEVHGFRYLDGRDLTGFIDGTENPKGRERAEVALVGAEDRAFAGGSFVFTQRYVHDLAKWGGLTVREQEAVIGRRKRDSRELSARAKPPTAHIARTVIEEDGEELEIVRHSFPYGTISECGLFFIAYTRDLSIPEKMLRRMLGAAGDGRHDRLMEFTRAVSGATFFAPSLRLLRSLGAA